jgi:hypothetical protein
MTKRERNMLIILGVVAVAALAIFLFVVRGGGEPAEEAAPTPTVTSPPPPAVEPTPEPDRRPRPPRAFAFFGGRDPFVPLVVEQVEPTDDTTDGAPPVEAPADGAEEEAREGVTMGGRNVSVIDVFTRDGRELVQVQVDGETFVVGEGDTFAGNFRVVSIEDPCATFLFGDETFTVCEPGERK